MMCGSKSDPEIFEPFPLYVNLCMFSQKDNICSFWSKKNSLEFKGIFESLKW